MSDEGEGAESQFFLLCFPPSPTRYPHPLVSDMGIQDLPFETLSRIFTIGCEHIDPHYLDPQVRKPRRSDSQPRQMMPFAQLASTVCRDWYTIVHASSNRHLWITYILHGGRDSPYDGFARTKDLLNKSNFSDIDLEVFISTGEDGYAGALSQDNRVIIRSMTLFIPHRHQLRVISIFSPPLLPILSALSALRPTPRLVLLRLMAHPKIPGLRPLAVSSTDSLHDPSFEYLDLTEASHCQGLIIRSWGALGEILVPPSHATSLDIQGCCHETAKVPWDSFVTFFSSASGVEELRLNPIHLCDTPQLKNVQFESVTWTHSFQSLKSLQITTDILTICTIMIFFSMPSLHSLDLDLKTPLDRGVTMLITSPEFPRSLGAPRPTTALSTLKLNIRDRYFWTRLHDIFVHVLLPRHIAKVTLSPGYTPGYDPPPYDWDGHPSPIVSTLYLRWSYPSSSWVFHISNWDPEVMELISEGGLFRDPPNSYHDMLRMERLRKLSFANCTLGEVNTFTTYLDAPLLRDIDIRLPAKYILSASSKLISTASRWAYHAVTSLTIDDWSGAPRKTDLRDILGAFINLISLRITIAIAETETTIVHMGRYYLHAIRDPRTCSRLERLTITLQWRSTSTPPDIAYREELREGLMESMATFVDTREYSSGASSSVSAQLFEVTNHGEDSEKTAVWNCR